MDITDAVAAIRARMTAAWSRGDVPVYWENENRTLSDTPAAFVFVEILPEAQRVSEFVGREANSYRTEGSILVHAFVPRALGTDAGFTLAEAAIAVFRGQRLDGITYGAGSIIGAAMEADLGNYWRCPVEVSFTFDSR